MGIGVGEEFEFAALSPAQFEAFMSAEGPGNQEFPPGPELTMTVVGIGDYTADRLQSSEANATAYVSTAFSHLYTSDAGHLGGPSGLGGLGYLWLDRSERSPT